MRKAFTLIEIVLTLVISSILIIGAFKGIEALYQRSARAKAITELSLRSQIVLDQIANLLYQRIPNTAIGYDPDCQSLKDSNKTHYILEWLKFDESNLIKNRYDSFVDMANSKKPILDTNCSLDNLSNYNLIFAGSFDSGDSLIPACKGAYGWHGNDSNLSFDIATASNNDINITDNVKPKYIYEKYYLTDGAYAVARSEDINLSSECIDNNLSNWQENNNTLLLFYGYHPWKGETFCADKNTSLTKAGSVTILSEDVNAFRAEYINNSIRISLEMNKSIRGSTAPIHISKQRGVF